MFVIPSDVLTVLNQLPNGKGPVVVGVSGGADSLYLTHILNKWCQKKKRPLLAVTVNHELRSDAATEAQWVHKQLKKHNIDHTILTWNGPKPKTRVEERAREKRYELLLDFCRKNKATTLFLAHHQQDQAETFWARLARGSGLDGLCAMSQVAKRDDILIVRPLLNMPKNIILQTLKRNHIKWVEDPMNQDTAYERVRWRKTQKDLDAMGLTSDYVTKSTQRLQRAKAALDFYTQQFMQQHLKKSPYCFVFIDESAFTALPDEVRIRVLIHLLKMFAPKEKVIPLDSVENIAITLPKYATLAGCQWMIAHHQIFVATELKHLTKTHIPAQKWTPWGAYQLWANKPFDAEACAPKPRIKNIPFLIQRTFLKAPKGYRILHLNSEKDLEKKVKLDYKDKAPIILIKLNKQKDKA